MYCLRGGKPRPVDGALCALGAGAGNSPTEVPAAAFERMGISTGVDVQLALAAAQDVVKPFIGHGLGQLLLRTGPAGVLRRCGRLRDRA